MFLLVGVLTVFAVFVATLFRWRKRHFCYFKNLGIPGPRPSLLWGNIREYHEKDHFKVLDKWLKKYGDTFGFYDGDVPFIVTKDLDFLEYVLVRNFQNFTDRGLEMVSEQSLPLVKNCIIFASGTKWRNMRRAIAACFTQAKLKQMMSELKNGSDIFLDIVEKLADSGQEANVYHLYQRLTMDYVGRGAFGVDCTFQKGPENSFSAAAKLVARRAKTGPFHLFCQSTSVLRSVMMPLYLANMFLGASASLAVIKEASKVIELRRTHPEYRRPDVLQNLLDAEYHEDSAAVDSDTAEDVKTSGGAWKSRAFTKHELLGSATALFVAGYETTSTALSYVSYLLAKHQNVQDKVRKEVNSAAPRNEDFDYGAVAKKLPYLNQVVNEALRLYPPLLLFVTRTAVSDFEYNGVRYKAGTCILSPTLQIHRDARYWPDPLTFDPDRFSPSNEGSFHSVAHQPFGIGPRNCVGMRMAQLQINFTIARLVQQFRLELGPSQGEHRATAHGSSSVGYERLRTKEGKQAVDPKLSGNVAAPSSTRTKKGRQLYFVFKAEELKWNRDSAA